MGAETHCLHSQKGCLTVFGEEYLLPLSPVEAMPYWTKGWRFKVSQDESMSLAVTLQVPDLCGQDEQLQDCRLSQKDCSGILALPFVSSVLSVMLHQNEATMASSTKRINISYCEGNWDLYVTWIKWSFSRKPPWLPRPDTDIAVQVVPMNLSLFSIQKHVGCIRTAILIPKSLGLL